MHLPKLSEILAYQNPHVLDYYCYHNPDKNYLAAKQLFSDLLAWLWLSIYRQQNHKKSYLFGPLLEIDTMWHSFLLHTRDYQDFCHQFFDAFFHHDIEPVAGECLLSLEEIDCFLNDSYKFLGEDWLLRYFSL